MQLVRIVAASFFSLLAFAGLAQAQGVGSVVAVTQAAELQRGAARTQLLQRMQLQLGDVISTGQSGRVQIVFADDTRIAVGANSRLVIEDILFDSGRTASRFSVRAIGGAFRFLSGNSPPEAYTVNTPLATLGVRGTIFDFSVAANRGVDVATFEGEVSLCYLTGGCAFVAGDCTILSAPAGGDRFEQPESQQDRRGILERHFPFVVAQQGLRRDFRAPVRSCGYSRLTDSRGAAPAGQSTRDAPSQGPSSPSSPPSGGSQAGGGASSGGGGASVSGPSTGGGGSSPPSGSVGSGRGSGG